MDEKGERSQVDVRALDADDIHPTPTRPLWMCCPSTPPYPSRSMVFKLDSVAEKRKTGVVIENVVGGGEIRLKRRG